MMPELLSPAGNREKLEAAVRYGCDAVYLSGKTFGMRCAADNFTPEELKDAVTYAHAQGVKVYLTVNTMPREGEYASLKEYLTLVTRLGIDAYIVADFGVFSLLKEICPGAEIHISTQANTVSSAACRAWAKLGARRVVLARELTLEDIVEIRQNTPDTLELEAFIHGSMCISYSGRCLLSGFFTGRDANRGACAQPCRWNYSVRNVEIVEEKRPDEPLTLTEMNGETFIMGSKDTCMIEHIPELMKSGVNSFKIEGRMKSAYDVAVVTNTYRMAMDAYEKGKYVYNPLWLSELESVSHREYATGYYFTDSKQYDNTATNNGYLKEKAYLATVLSYDKEKQLALCVQKNKQFAEDKLERLTPGKTGIPFVGQGLFDENGTPISSTPHPYMKFYLKTDTELAAGDIIRSGMRD
ncbi:MAG: U32 family peptidase [Clostridia bacterium]|nr:U32 family peptidase [Clostridia bacterium]